MCFLTGRRLQELLWHVCRKALSASMQQTRVRLSWQASSSSILIHLPHLIYLQVSEIISMISLHFEEWLLPRRKTQARCHWVGQTQAPQPSRSLQEMDRKIKQPKHNKTSNSINFVFWDRRFLKINCPISKYTQMVLHSWLTQLNVQDTKSQHCFRVLKIGLDCLANDHIQLSQCPRGLNDNGECDQPERFLPDHRMVKGWHIWSGQSFSLYLFGCLDTPWLSWHSVGCGGKTQNYTRCSSQTSKKLTTGMRIDTHLLRVAVIDPSP